MRSQLLERKLFSSRLRHSETLIEFCIPRHFARLFLLLVIDPDWQLSFFLVSSPLAASLLAYENHCVLVLALQPYAWKWPEHKTQLYVECGYTATGYPAFPHDETSTRTYAMLLLVSVFTVLRVCLIGGRNDVK